MREQIGRLLWDHGVDNADLLDALTWKCGKLRDERDKLREALARVRDEHTRQMHFADVEPSGDVREFAHRLDEILKEAGQ